MLLSANNIILTYALRRRVYGSTIWYKTYSHVWLWNRIYLYLVIKQEIIPINVAFENNHPIRVYSFRFKSICNSNTSILVHYSTCLHFMPVGSSAKPFLEDFFQKISTFLGYYLFHSLQFRNYTNLFIFDQLKFIYLRRVSIQLNRN